VRPHAGPAIVVDGGAQVRVEGNCMESNLGPAVIASGSTALAVSTHATLNIRATSTLAPSNQNSLMN
jgi:hypothetical protein